MLLAQRGGRPGGPALEAQEPLWQPGTEHAVTFGFLVGEVVRWITGWPGLTTPRRSVWRSWRRVIADLGSDYRHITYDERARGKSTRSANYSLEGAVRILATGASHGSRFTSEKGSP